MKKYANTTATTNDANNTFSGMTFTERQEMLNRKNALKARENVTFKPLNINWKDDKHFDVPVDILSTESWKNFMIIIESWKAESAEKHVFSDLVSDAEKNPCESTFRALSPAMVLCVLRRMLDVTPDNEKVREMYYDCIKNPWSGSASDHVNTAFIELWSAMKTENKFQFELLKTPNICHRYWLTRKIMVNKPTKQVVISDTLDTVATYREVETSVLREIFHKIRQNIASYDSFKSYDGRYSYIELDNATEGTKIYQRLVYNIDTLEDENRLRVSTADLKLSESETKVLAFRLKMPFAGYKVIAKSLKMSQETVKSALKRIRNKALSIESLKNVLDFNNASAHEILANSWNEKDSSPISRGSYDTETANKLSEMSNIPIHVDPQSDAEFTGADISIVANEYKVNLHKSTDYLNPPIFEHYGKLENISYATWMFANSHKGAIVIR